MPGNLTNSGGLGNSRRGGVYEKRDFSFNGGPSFTAVKWKQTKSSKYTCHGFRSYTEKALELELPVLKKQYWGQAKQGIVRKYMGPGTGYEKRLVRAFNDPSIPIMTMDKFHMEMISDSYYDSGSYTNGGVLGAGAIDGGLTAGKSLGIGHDVWNEMRARMDFPPGATSTIRAKSEIVLIHTGTGHMMRGRIENTGAPGPKGHNSLDLFVRSAADKMRVYNQEIATPGGILHNSSVGDIYIAFYDPSKHAGMYWWGDFCQVEDRDEDLFEGMCIWSKDEDAQDILKDKSPSEDGFVFDDDKQLDHRPTYYPMLYGQSYKAKSNTRINVDGGSVFKKLGPYKKLIGTGMKQQHEGQGSDYTYIDPADQPPDWKCKQRRTECARYLLFKKSGDIDGNGRKIYYDIYDEADYKPIACGKSLWDIVFEHDALNPDNLDRGAYVYVFAFLGWSGKQKKKCFLGPPQGPNDDPEGSDREYQDSGESFYVWKFTHEDQETKPVYADYGKTS